MATAAAAFRDHQRRPRGLLLKSAVVAERLAGVDLDVVGLDKTGHRLRPPRLHLPVDSCVSKAA